MGGAQAAGYSGVGGERHGVVGSGVEDVVEDDVDADGGAGPAEAVDQVEGGVRREGAGLEVGC